MRKILILILAIIAWIPVAGNMTQRQEVVNIKIQLLCQDNPKKDCAGIDQYCRKALEMGKECYLID